MTNPLRSSILAIAATLIAVPAALTSVAAAQAAPENLQLISADAKLVETLDTKNAAQGQIVTAKLTSGVKNAGATELPKGTMLLGKVEQVRISTHNGPAQLSIVFDQARLSDGRTVPIKATLLGAYPADTGEYWDETGAAGPPAAVEPHIIPADEKVDQEPGTLGQVSLQSSVRSNSSGVFLSKDRNIHLKTGTQFEIAVAIEPGSSQG
jgi:hypothetical protein